MMMNATTGKLMILIALVLTLGLFSLEQSASAQSNCRKVKGKFIDVTSGGSTTGTITNGGILNSTTETVFSPAFLFTPDPTTVSFTADSTFTTNRGVLTTHNVYIFDFARGVATALYRIDPNASTGIFAGAAGVLYVNGKETGPGTVEGNITGEICFAPDDDEPDEDEDDDN
jgi:hypothetical protein